MKKLRSKCWVFSFIVVVLVCGFFAARIGLHNYYCSSYMHQVIPSNGGDYEAVVNEENCDAFGSLNISSIKLRKKSGWGFETTIFLYEPSYAEGDMSENPSVRWLTSNKLEVSINTISQVRAKITESHGVHIVYNIGEIKYP